MPKVQLIRKIAAFVIYSASTFICLVLLVNGVAKDFDPNIVDAVYDLINVVAAFAVYFVGRDIALKLKA